MYCEKVQEKHAMLHFNSFGRDMVYFGEKLRNEAFERLFYFFTASMCFWRLEICPQTRFISAQTSFIAGVFYRFCRTTAE